MRSNSGVLAADKGECAVMLPRNPRTKEAAEKALKEMEGTEVGQWRVRCGWAHHKSEAAVAPLDPAAVDKADPANNNVYIGNLSAEVAC